MSRMPARVGLLANRKATAAREPAESIGDPSRYVRQIVEGEQMAIASCDKEIAF